MIAWLKHKILWLILAAFLIGAAIAEFASQWFGG